VLLQAVRAPGAARPFPAAVRRPAARAAPAAQTGRARAGVDVLRKLPLLAHVDLRLSGSEGAADATLAAVRSLALCSRLVRAQLGLTQCLFSPSLSPSVLL